MDFSTIGELEAVMLSAGANNKSELEALFQGSPPIAVYLEPDEPSHSGGGAAGVAAGGPGGGAAYRSNVVTGVNTRGGAEGGRGDTNGVGGGGSGGNSGQGSSGSGGGRPSLKFYKSDVGGDKGSNEGKGSGGAMKPEPRTASISNLTHLLSKSSNTMPFPEGTERLFPIVVFIDVLVAGGAMSANQDGEARKDVDSKRTKEDGGVGKSGKDDVTERVRISLSVPEACTSVGAIALTMAKYEKMRRSEGLQGGDQNVWERRSSSMKLVTRLPPLLSEEMYELRVADARGDLDEDLPMSLERQATVSSIGVDTFQLVLLNPPPVQGGVGSGGSASTRSGTGAARKASDKLLIRIKLLNGTYQTHQVSPSITLRELLRKVSERAKLDMTLFHFKLIGNVHAPLDPSLTVQTIDADELVLVAKPDASLNASTLARSSAVIEAGTGVGRVGSGFGSGRGVAQGGGTGGGTGKARAVAAPDPEVDVSPDDVFWTEITASQYKEFSVIKINKWGHKQQRVMGIDKDRITNTIPAKNATTFLGMQRLTHKASRQIDQVQTIEKSTTHPRHFRIVFREGFDLIPTDYIANTPAECAEIVSKISYLKMLCEEGSSPL